MQRLKADFHTHTADDPHDCILHTSEQLIAAAAAAGIQVLAITCHDRRVYSSDLAEYAGSRGVLLIPGVEKQIEGRHVVILNPEKRHLHARTFREIRDMGKGDAIFIAPHPYYPIGCSLRERLLEQIDLFDAIEYASFYWYGCNFNRKAARVAHEHALPMVGNSDTHVLPYCDSTFTWVESESSIGAVLNAIRNGQIEVATRPRPLGSFLSMLGYAVRGMISNMTRSPLRPITRRDEKVLPE